ncbi:hypothetical protein B6I21_04595 [candidate division KSB1 bacterium 4572_119]|nr:MAG: hypothetical protein B6I21_04595 [candidate division KSB1 bacterium 4572_119]
MRKNKFFIMLFSLLFVFSGFATFVSGQQATKVVTSTGVASIFSNDVGLARDQATDDALRKAVEQTLGTFIQSSTLVENNMVVQDNILSWSNGYVRTHKILREGKTDPSTYQVIIEAVVELAILQGNTQMASAIAKKLGAEVIITGKTIAKVATGFNLGGMKSCQANITARVIKADVATIIATGSSHAAYPHIDEVTGGTEAIKKATNKLSTELLNKITQKWKDEFYKSTTVKVVVHGVKSFTQVNDFKNTVKYFVRGVKEIYNRNIAGSMAELDVKITGNASQLARELEKKDLDKFDVKIIGLTMNKITIQISDK